MPPIMIVVLSSSPVANPNPKAAPTGVSVQKPSLEMAQEKKIEGTTAEEPSNHNGDEPQDEQRRKGIGRFLRAD